MKRYWSYFKYVIRHKWHVLVAGLNLDVNIWRLLAHDLRKFKPSEFIPYARTFYKPDGSSQYDETVEFNQAWNLHQKRNEHHWQMWCLKKDDGDLIPLPMTTEAIAEMVADWAGAGIAINGKQNVSWWYKCNSHKIVLHKETRAMVEWYIEKLEEIYG